MNGKLIKLVVSGTVVIGLITGTASCATAKAEELTVNVEKGDIAVTVASDGNLALINDRKLTFQTSGIVKEVPVKEGDSVTQGQVLAKLDTAPMELNVESANLAVRSAEYDLQVANDSYQKITYPYTFSTLAFSVPDSLAMMTATQRNIDEIQKAIAGGVTQDEMVILNQNLVDAQDNLTKAKEKLGLGVGPDLFTSGRLPISSFWTLRDAELNMNKAQLGIDTAKNALEQANDELPKAVITAPFDGVLAEVNVKEGDNISAADAASKVIFYLVDKDNLELKGTVDEIDVAKVALDQKATISLDALPDVKIPGTVTYIAPVSRVEGGVVVYDIKIKLDNVGDLPLKSGMTAKADIVTESKAGVLLVPEKSITRNNGNATVSIKVNDKIEQKTVGTGMTDGVNTEVTAGLTEGEAVIINPKA